MSHRLQLSLKVAVKTILRQKKGWNLTFASFCWSNEHSSVEVSGRKLELINAARFSIIYKNARNLWPGVRLFSVRGKGVRSSAHRKSRRTPPSLIFPSFFWRTKRPCLVSHKKKIGTFRAGPPSFSLRALPPFSPFSSPPGFSIRPTSKGKECLFPSQKVSEKFLFIGKPFWTVLFPQRCFTPRFSSWRAFWSLSSPCPPPPPTLDWGARGTKWERLWGGFQACSSGEIRRNNSTKRYAKLTWFACRKNKNNNLRPGPRVAARPQLARQNGNDQYGLDLNVVREVRNLLISREFR